MKTTMHIKTDGRSLYSRENEEKKTRKTTKKKNRPTVSNGAIGCAALIALLAASGYAGTSAQDRQQMTAAPVISREIAPAKTATMTFEEVSAKYDAQRTRELAILNDVIGDEDADAETKKNAQAQKIQIVQRMEMEAGVEAALAHMGVGEAAVVSGDGSLVLMIPSLYADEQDETTRIVDAVTAVSGCEAKDVKIILVKK